MASDSTRDEAIRELARRELERRRQASPLGDIGRSAGAGLASGITGILDPIMNALVPPNTGKAMRDLQAMSEGQSVNFPPMATPTRDLAASVSGGATEYEPTTIAGDYARTGAEFASNALVPGGLVRKAASVLVPAIASETAGQATKGTAAEPFARIAGALTPIGWGKEITRAVKQAAKAASSPEALGKAIDHSYEMMRNGGIIFKPDSVAALAKRTHDQLTAAAMHPSTDAEAFTFVDRLVKGSDSIDYATLDRMSSRIGAKVRSLYQQKNEAAAVPLEMVRDAIEDFMFNGPLVATTAKMSPAQINEVRRNAKRLVIAKKKSEAVSEAIENASYGQDFTKGLQSQLGNLVRSRRGKQLFTASERSVITAVGNGNKALNVLQIFGINTSGGLGNLGKIGAAGMGMGADFMTGGAVTAASVGVGMAAPALAKHQAGQLQGAMRNTAGLTGPLSIEENLAKWRRILSGAQATRESQP